MCTLSFKLSLVCDSVDVKVVHKFASVTAREVLNNNLMYEVSDFCAFALLYFLNCDLLFW